MPQSTMITIGNLICGFEVEEVPSITISGSLAEFKRDRELQDNDLRIIIKGSVLLNRLIITYTYKIPFSNLLQSTAVSKHTMQSHSGIVVKVLTLRHKHHNLIPPQQQPFGGPRSSQTRKHSPNCNSFRDESGSLETSTPGNTFWDLQKVQCIKYNDGSLSIFLFLFQSKIYPC